MAANAPPELASANPCCLAWQGKYIGMKKRRDAFKEAVALLQKAIGDANAEKSNLEKKLEEMVADKDSKENDSVVKVSLEKEISDLKSVILSLQQRLEQSLKEKSEEIKLLQDQASSREKEITELKDILQKETLRVKKSEEQREKLCKELNKTKSPIVKNEEIKPLAPQLIKEISLLKNLIATEKQKTESERKKAELEEKKVDQYLSELEVLRTIVHKTSSDLLTVTSNLETVKKQLGLEKQKTLKERKRADMESAKAREQMKLAEDFSKKFEIFRARNEELKKEAELQSASSIVKFAENSTKLEEKIRLLEMKNKTAIDWKSRAGDLTRQLQEAHFASEGLKNQVHEVSLSQKPTKSCSVSHKVRDLEKAEVRLLKKELKFERKCAKHSKRVAKFEKFRREFQVEEVARLKLGFSSLSNSKNLLDEYFSSDVEGTAGIGKATGCMKVPKLQSVKNHNGEKLSDARCHLVASSGFQEQTRKFSSDHLIPKSGRAVSESISGTISQLESPTGGSRKLQSSGVNSSATSFSDGQLLASQGRDQFSVSTSAEITKDKPNIQSTKSIPLRKFYDTRNNGDLDLLADNNLQSCQRESREVVREHSRKRKTMSQAVGSHKRLSSDDKKKNLQIGQKPGTVPSVVVGTGYMPLEEEETLVVDMQGGPSAKCIAISKTRRVGCETKPSIQNSLEFNWSGKTPGNITGSTQTSGKTMCLSTAKGRDVATVFLDDVAATDYMKLLELDKTEESYYKIARESLLSPDLPQVDFLGGEIVNVEKNPAKALDLVASSSVDLCDTSEGPRLNNQNASVAVKMSPMSTRMPDHTLKHFVVFSNIEDQNSIIKIFQAANNCIQRCPSVTAAHWAVPAILFTLKMENLLAQERVCVFLSLLLHNFSVVSSIKSGSTLNVDSFSCLDSFSKHIYGVMGDVEAGGMLTEFSEELLSLLQDFLSEQRVLFSVKSSETAGSDLSISVTLKGEEVVLVSRVALIDHLVAGSCILAATCSVLDRVGFICEACCEILHKQNHEKTSVSLTILHVFAYIAEGKMLCSSEHDISIAVLKSIVMFLENRDWEGKAKLHPGRNKCPFSERSSSLEAVAYMLVGILEEFTHANTLHQSLTGSLGSSHLEFIPTQKDFECVLTRDQSVTLSDTLSLVELIACYTAWDWTSVNIVAPLLKMLGKPLPMNLSVAIVSLVGQLGSIGVDAGGYENEGISHLREELSAFLQCETTLKAGFGVQIATVNSLLKTLQLDFPITFQGEPTMVEGGGNHSSSSDSVNLVAKWFSLLSVEQRVFASELLQTSVAR